MQCYFFGRLFSSKLRELPQSYSKSSIFAGYSKPLRGSPVCLGYKVLRSTVPYYWRAVINEMHKVRYYLFYITRDILSLANRVH